MSEDDHALCKVKLDVAVLNTESKANALALVLARDLAAAESIKTMLLVSTAIGWLIAIALGAFAFLRH
jgi:hypothetical protein